ncbi:hypothetical protein HW555_009477 [Spodoptera exigua]|uniref:Uncharacterized protein n=1 Tax=Spodoptera exigua TaxID=7107 RepID=A0A835L1S9_SPOEX|nr:hypothetical protein HW555_009477 [Spodoptera exigua]
MKDFKLLRSLIFVFGSHKFLEEMAPPTPNEATGSVRRLLLTNIALKVQLPAEPNLTTTLPGKFCGFALTLPITASINETCMFNEQCEDVYFKTECRNERCACKFEMVPEVTVDGSVICTSVKPVEESTRTLDPAMIGVLVGMALMFVIICVVLRLFSRARWRENRTIFNTPNPRLMNVSLLRDSKLLHSQDRRGSRVSVRPPSRQASQQELRPHSPGPGSRRGSRASSGHSATSLRSATLRSPTTPGPTSVTVEIRAPEV